MKDIVAISGANGTIGMPTVLHALAKDYNVRCIVRSEKGVEQIKTLLHLKCSSSADSRVEYSIVRDNTIPGAYDESISDAKYVIHIAGVWPIATYHPDNDIYWPFVKSMENILSAAEKSGTVRRIVFTQAGAGLVSADDTDLGRNMDRALNENIRPSSRAKSLRPPLATPHHAYCAAKAYCMSHLLSLRGKVPFSIAQVIPGTVIGPPQLDIPLDEALTIMDRMSKGILFDDIQPKYAFGFVNVNDCAKVHVEALREDIRDESIPDFFIAASSTESGKTMLDIWKEICCIIENEFRDEVKGGIFKVGSEKCPQNAPFYVDNRLTERLIFGEGNLDEEKTFKNYGECVKGIAQWYIRRLKSKGPGDHVN